jgi:hypothetical protein
MEVPFLLTPDLRALARPTGLALPLLGAAVLAQPGGSG